DVDRGVAVDAADLRALVRLAVERHGAAGVAVVALLLGDLTCERVAQGVPRAIERHRGIPAEAERVGPVEHVAGRAARRAALAAQRLPLAPQVATRAVLAVVVEVAGPRRVARQAVR